jgi:lipopolysaccharide biosynthesis protein
MADPNSPIQRVLRAPLRVPRKLAAWSAMAAFLSPAGQAAWRLLLAKRRAAAAVSETSASPRAACVAHVYYIDLLPEVLACWRSLPAGSPLFLTVPVDRADMLGGALAATLTADERELATQVASANRGRDIAPFLALLSSGALDRFDAVLKIHTKKSPHLMDGGLRRRLVYALLAGATDQAAAIVSLFRDPSLGMAGSRWTFRTRPAMWMANRERVAALAGRMSPPGAAELGFFEGSMFWVRPAALAPLRSLGLGQEDFEAEAGQLDGALHHAIERLFTISARASGCRITDLRGRALAFRKR